MARPAAHSPKAARIVEAALGILREQGDRSLTMRGVASQLGMSLSNVQYYFRDKDKLVCAMVDYYVEQCGEELADLTRELSALPLADRRRRLLQLSLRHGHEMSEMCRTFREIWAIGARSEEVDGALTGYYQRYLRLLAPLLLPEAPTEALTRKVGLLIVPYVEGYSITGAALSREPDEAVALIMELLEALTGT